MRASAGWLLQQCGHRPGERLAEGVYCSTRRTLTLVARFGATAGAFAETLHRLADQVERLTGIRLEPEPATVGYPHRTAEPRVRRPRLP